MAKVRAALYALCGGMGLAHLAILVGDRAWRQVPEVATLYICGAVIVWSIVRGEEED
jgi:hypothetical protein